MRTPDRRRQSQRCVALAFVIAVGTLALVAAPASAKTKTKTTTPATVLANLKVQAAAVTVKASGKTKYVAAKDGQALRQGDAIKTDATGKAEIDYTDGSLTRLGTSTEFTITRLTNNQGGRQTEGTINVGETWSHASKVSETSSFEVKAGGTTAAVAGTAFSFTYTLVNGQLTATVISVVDTVTVSGANGTTQLPPATKLVSISGNLGPVVNLTFDELNGNVQISGNLLLDQQAGKGKGLDDLPPPPAPTTTPPTTTTAPPGGGGGGGVGSATVTQQDVPPRAAADAGPYPPNGGIVVDNPTIVAGGTETFRGTGCGPNEVLTVLFDGKVIGTITANSQGAFAGSITIPKDAAQGAHTLTVRGASCELNATITVSGTLAFTGASSHTGTYVLLGIAAIVFGMVLVVATRRRRRGRTISARGSP